MRTRLDKLLVRVNFISRSVIHFFSFSQSANKAAYRGMNMQEGAPSMLYEEMLDDYGDSCTNLNFRGSHDGKVKNTVKTLTL